MALSIPDLRVVAGTGIERIAMIDVGNKMIEEGNERIAERTGGVTGTIVATEAGTVGNMEMIEEVEMITGIVIGMIGVTVVVGVTVRIDGIRMIAVIGVIVEVIGVTVGVTDGTVGIEMVIGVIDDLVAEVSWPFLYVFLYFIQSIIEAITGQ
jgi:hypothetical protein